MPGQRTGRRFDPTPGRVRYSRRWMGATAAGGVLASLAVAAAGLPAMVALGIAGAAGAAYALLHEPRNPRLEQITLRFADLPRGLDGMRIGQISDMHLGMRYTAENGRWAVAQMARERPDLLVFTGDFVSYEHAIPDLPVILAGLPRAPLGAFAVPGNHDYWEGVPEIQRALAPLGIEFLINAHRRLTFGGDEFVLAGVDDLWDGAPDLRVTLDDAPRGMFTLLLAHCPDVADEAAEHGVHVQLSGHTHGGHMCLPGLGSFCLPRYGWRYPIGHEWIGATQLYVSRGLGGLPLRLGCSPEATIITLRRG
ncbi:MAG: metallophosphoesterase [Chloroflexales bacterium]|nr:metallophosphoesterase [Chloroflexales bacterium]